MTSPSMGIVYADVTILSADRTREVELRLVVDTGSVLTWLPGNVLRQLGIVPTHTRRFRSIERETPPKSVGEARIRCQGLSGTVPIVFGEEGDASVLGVTALEILGLAVDPNTGRLKQEDVSLALASA
ncbi:MAG: hypothetical protein HY557_04545 [Euryarchaeota archaeon]|nr:hypothetical protein [Euryarchaeota archaeon]